MLSSTIHPYPTQAEALHKIGDAYMRTKLTPTVQEDFYQVAGVATVRDVRS